MKSVRERHVVCLYQCASRTPFYTRVVGSNFSIQIETLTLRRSNDHVSRGNFDCRRSTLRRGRGRSVCFGARGASANRGAGGSAKQWSSERAGRENAGRGFEVDFRGNRGAERAGQSPP